MLPAHTPAMLLCNKQLFIVRNYFIVMARQALHTHIHAYSQIAAYTTCLHNVELIIIISVLLHPLNSHYSPSQLLVMIVLLGEWVFYYTLLTRFSCMSIKPFSKYKLLIENNNNPVTHTLVLDDALHDNIVWINPRIF